MVRTMCEHSVAVRPGSKNVMIAVRAVAARPLINPARPVAHPQTGPAALESVFEDFRVVIRVFVIWFDRITPLKLGLRPCRLRWFHSSGSHHVLTKLFRSPLPAMTPGHRSIARRLITLVLLRDHRRWIADIVPSGY
jgi:hypothetical protein